MLPRAYTHTHTHTRTAIEHSTAAIVLETQNGRHKSTFLLFLVCDQIFVKV